MNKTNLLYLALAACILAACSSEKAASPEVEPGVSLALAGHRKSVISRLGYDLKLEIPASKAAAIQGHETIRFHLAAATADLQLDFKEATDHLQSIAVNGKPIATDHRQEHIVIPAEALQTGPNTVEIAFVAGELSLNRNEEYLYTLLVPDRARTVFPCFDQPNLKASFQLQLGMPAGWQALTNGPLLDSLAADDRKTFRFHPSDTISTYLFAFAAGEFKKASREVDGRTMTFFHRETDPEKISESMDPIFDLHAKALTFLEAYTGIPYPFRKFDFVAIPDFQYGGMEHVGAIQYRAASLFLDKSATEARKIGRANLIAHETAHMWFGDLVTMDWFNDVWMKEVFANFMADKVSEVTFPDTGSDLKFLLNHYPAAYSVDRTAGANPVRQELGNLNEAGSLYGSIIYHKAPIVMKQLEMLMGKAAFQQGLQTYLSQFAFGNATWTDLVAVLDELTPADLQTWNRVWVEQPFRPVFNYELKLDGNAIASLTITQEAERSEGAEEKVWPQHFEIALGYGDSLHRLQVQSITNSVSIDSAAGLKAPDFVVFNTSGDGYGIFPVDPRALPYIAKWTDPVARASAYVNNYESMLNGASLAPGELIKHNLALIGSEREELSLRQLTGQLSSAFWQFTTAANRSLLAPEVENSLWRSMEAATEAGAKKIIFQGYQQVASTEQARAQLYAVWKNQRPPEGVRLAEDDYTDLAATVSLLGHPEAVAVQQVQLQRILNEDRKKRWAFLLPSLSADTAVRRQFFESLKLAANREKESWVSTAVGYLHHPLRHGVSVGYLAESLELLLEIQQTGDIFFPTAWLSATFGSHNRPEAAAIVDRFLASHPDYPTKLKAKILQTTDDLQRAIKLMGEGEVGL